MNNKYIYFIWVQLIPLMLFFTVSAQNQIDDFQFLSVEPSLSQNTATTILQDKNGFLWVGTRSGLNKYDGINMVSYYHDEFDSTSLSSNYVRVIYETRSGELWFGTDDGGLSKYNDVTDSFLRYEADGTSNSISGNSIYAIYEDEDTNLWIGTQNYGLNFFNQKTGEFTHYRKNPDDPFSISGNSVTGIARDSRNNLWVSTWGGGLNLFDVNAKRFIHYQNDPKNKMSISSNVVEVMYAGPEGTIWLGTDMGLDKLVYKETGQFKFEHINLVTRNSSSVVLSLMQDRKNRLWVGTENEGINLIDLNSGKTIQHVYDPKYENSIQNNSIWSIFEDNTGIIWIGTFNKGLFKLDENLRKFRSVKHSMYSDNSLTNNSVSSFVEDKYHNIWVGTDGGGLDYWNTKNNTFEHFNKYVGVPIANEVLALTIDRNENLWVGTWHGGLMIKKKGSSSFKPFYIVHPMVPDTGKEHVFSIIEDSKGRIWMTLYRNGLMMYDPNNQEFVGFKHDEWNDKSISSNFVRGLMEDDQGNIWIGTEGGGLNRLYETEEGVMFERFLNDSNDPNSISGNSIICLVQDNNGDMWIGTSTGLSYYNTKEKKFTRYGKRDGLPDEVIHAIQLDENDNLWLSSNRGLSKFSLKTNDIRNYDQNDGLQSMEFFKNASYKLSSGELLFGGVNGFNIFQPNEITENKDEPTVYLSGFKISNKKVVGGVDSPLKSSLSEAKEIRLNHDQDDFSFEFALLSFSQSSRNEYAYQLVNYDDEWQEIGKRREAYYTNVPPGSYIFKVKGTSNDGRWSPNEASVDLYISRPWYNSYMAYAIYVMIIAALFIWVFRAMVNRERLQNQLQLDHMELSKMQELDEMKSSFFANISHEFRSPLTLILGPLNAMKEAQIYESTKDQVDVMIRNAESLINLINQLLELSKLESGKMRLDIVHLDVVSFLKPVVHSFSSLANRKFVNYKISFPENQVMMYFDKEKLEKIMINLISNALKYTSDFGSIEIKLEEKGEEVEILVIDNGMGIPADEIGFVFNRYYRVRRNNKKKGTGIGLSLTKELVEIHRGRIELESEQGKGSIFKVYLKRGKSHLNEEDILESSEEDYSFEKVVDEVLDQPKQQQTVSDAFDSFDNQLSKLPLVLVIEDNDDIRSYIRQIMENNHKIIEANNGNDGLRLAMEQIPDLIISDIMMPGIDGLELCKKVKADIKTSHIPVVLLTAKASDNSALDGFEVGADYYITKPFSPKMLTLRVRNALKIKTQIKERLLNKDSLDIEPSQVKITSKDEDFINKAVAIIEDNMSNSEFYVDDLGKELGLSRMQLYRKLKGLIDQSANEFVRSIRLKRAAQLITQNQLTISEITYQVGFNDLQYFRDCFKKQFGVNPSEYAVVTKSSKI